MGGVALSPRNAEGTMPGDGSASCCVDIGWPPPVLPPLRRATKAVPPLELQPPTDADPRCQRSAGLADSRPLHRRQLPDVPLGPRSARVTWGHELLCRPAPGASAAATAVRSSFQLLAARVSMQAIAVLLRVPMAAPNLWFLNAEGPNSGDGLSILQPQSRQDEDSLLQDLEGAASIRKPRPPDKNGRGLR